MKLAALTVILISMTLHASMLFAGEGGAVDAEYLETCPVTLPNGSTPPGERHSSNHHGNGKLWTGLFPNGLIEFGSGRPGFIRDDGVLSMKFPWWLGENVRGSFKITGRRLDGDVPPAFGDSVDGHVESGFIPSMVFFPTEGCWEITGSVGDATLSFVQFVLVVRQDDRGWQETLTCSRYKIRQIWG